jgi:HYDIN/CFA65/VesB-like, Ig-like domain
MARGFVEIRDYQRMLGRVVKVHSAIAGDGDWNIDVSPTNKSFLINHRGRRNTNGVVECEVQTPEHVYSGASSEHVRNDIFRRYMNRLQDRRVEVVGTWVADCAHSNEGEDCRWPFRCCDRGKSEIHPITSILACPPSEAATPVRRFEFYVFSDSSSGPRAILHPALHAHTSRTGNFRVPIGPIGLPGESSGSYNIVTETALVESRHVTVVQEDGQWIFRNLIQSGRASENKGFYQATIDLIYEGKRLGITPPIFVPVQVGVSVVKTLTLRNEGTAPLSVVIPPPAGASPFQWTPSKSMLAEEVTMQVGITFRPTAVGALSGDFVVTTDAPGSPHHVSLAGKGYSPECPGLLEKMAGLELQIQGLQERLETASPSMKASLAANIGEKQSELADLESRSIELGCS